MTAGSLFAAGGDGDAPLATNPAPDSRLEPATPATGPASLYRKYRPQSFESDDMVGQDHVVRTLRNTILLDRVAHAYLFSGPRGTGKTTTARLLAKAINCMAPDPAARPCNTCTNCIAINLGSSPDVIEIDAASNRGIDDIRDLRDRVRYAPAQLPRKVYIIDEAHQITGAAANAFLKTLEEPPAHTHFILATTDPEELLPTIVSRCQRFEFRRIGIEDMVRRLRIVGEAEGILVDLDAMQAIARHATGSLRDALGLLEQLALQQGGPVAGPIGVLDVQAALGLSRNDRIEALVDALSRYDARDALSIVQQAIDGGEDPRQLNRQLLGYLRHLLYLRAGSGSDVDQRAQALAAAFSLEQLAAHARRFSEIDFSIKHSPFPQLPLEVALVEAAAQPAASHTATSQGVVPVAADPSAETREVRPTSLRDRVRGTAPAVVPALPPRMETDSPPAAPITPIRPDPPPVPLGSPAIPGDLSVERIVELWPAIRADVKALNRRVEALLSEVDPVAIAGNHVTLAVPYPFHRDKLNAEEVRETIAGVLSRQLARTVSISCVLRGELGQTAPAPAVQPAANGVSSVESHEPGENESEERAAARILAAKNIFDAEEIARNGDGRPANAFPGATG